MEPAIAEKKIEKRRKAESLKTVCTDSRRSVINWGKRGSWSGKSKKPGLRNGINKDDANLSLRDL